MPRRSGRHGADVLIRVGLAMMILSAACLLCSGRAFVATCAGTGAAAHAKKSAGKEATKGVSLALKASIGSHTAIGIAVVVAVLCLGAGFYWWCEQSRILQERLEQENILKEQLEQEKILQEQRMRYESRQQWMDFVVKLFGAIGSVLGGAGVVWQQYNACMNRRRAGAGGPTVVCTISSASRRPSRRKNEFQSRCGKCVKTMFAKRESSFQRFSHYAKSSLNV